MGIVTACITLLLFSIDAMKFGVYTGQIQEILDMADTVRLSSGERDIFTVSYQEHTIRILDFAEYLRHMEQPSHVIPPHQPQGSSVPSSPSSSFSQENTLHLKKVLLIKQPNTRYGGVSITNPETLQPISMDHIHALPVLMERNRHMQSIWGIALIDNCTVTLINLEQL